jgi:type III secretion system chaperone SycN
MGQFSRMTIRVIESFAANIGLPAQAAPDQSYGFEFERSGSLSFVPSEDGTRILVCLTRVPRHPDRRLHWRLLALPGVDASAGTLLHAGLSPDGGLVLAADLDETEFTIHTLDQALSRLIELQDSLS